MRALTIHEPYASLLVKGIKPFEFRSWNTNIRGPVAIHSALKPMDEAGKELAFKYQIDPEYGKVLGAVNILSSTLVSEVSGMKCTLIGDRVLFFTPEQLRMGYSDFGDYQYAWYVEPVVEFAEPFPAKGQQGFWNWDERTV